MLGSLELESEAIGRKSLWIKGQKSGNIQEIKKVYLDCDSDTLLFLVSQKGVACHRNKRTCFEV